MAIGATTKSSDPELWPSSSVGPTELGTYGIFAVAPGVSINSAKADGFDDSMNNALRISSGTSMATPIAHRLPVLFSRWSSKDGFWAQTKHCLSIICQKLPLLVGVAK